MGKLNTAFYPERLESLGDIETKAVLKKLVTAHKALAELKDKATGTLSLYYFAYWFRHNGFKAPR